MHIRESRLDDIRYISNAVKPADRVALSVVTPVYNEEGNIPELVENLLEVMDNIGKSFEIIAVNDGSMDKSLEELKNYAERRSEVKVIDFRRNHGQTAAIMAGIDYASGDILILIDADMQNDPSDIPRLLDKIDEGYDVVSGWRQNRKDAKFRRNFISRVANRLISGISGVHLHDYGCTLKVYNRHVLLGGMRLYGEMHRFIPIYATWMGACVTELPVKHHRRKRGESKYGMKRIFKVILDLCVIMFMDRYLTKPIYFFGTIGLTFTFLSLFLVFAAIYLKIFYGYSFVNTPLPLLSVMTFLAGVSSLLLGIAMEVLTRTYFEAQHHPSYHVGEFINFDFAGYPDGAKRA